MIRIKDNLKTYGKDTELWYFDHQGETYPVTLDTRKGFLVHRPEVEGARMYLVKNKHAEWVDEEPLDDEIV